MEKGKNIKNTYPVLGMSCALCAARVDKTLNGLPGVYQATVNYATVVAQVEYNPEVCSDATLQAAVQDAGYDLLVDTSEDVADKAEEIRLTRYRKIKRRTVAALLLSLPIMVISMFYSLGLSANIHPVAIIPIGYPVDSKYNPTARKSIDEIVTIL